MRFRIAFALALTITLLLLAGVTPGAAIVIRHDRADSEYLTLGDRFPAVVRIGPRMGDGTLVAPDWVLTAAHVARGFADRAGGHVEIEGEAFAVAAVYVHPEFRRMGPHDFGLLRLERPAAGIEPLPLYAGADEAGREAVLVGHGATGTGDGPERTEDGRRRGATNIVELADAHHLVFRFDAPPAGTHLEGIPGAGDSGGPALIEVAGRFRVAGVSSAGRSGPGGPGSYGSEDFFGRVATHRGWIDDVLAGRAEPYGGAGAESGSATGAPVAADLDGIAAGSPAGARLVELWRLVQSPEADIGTFIEASIAGELLERTSAERLTTALGRIRDEMGGHTLVRTRAVDGGLDAFLRGPGGERILGVRVEPEEPHRIVAILTGRP